MPASTPDFMAEAWIGCIRWAMGRRELWDAFFGERPDLRELVDTRPAPGSADGDRLAQEYIEWVNRNVWGECPVPGRSASEPPAGGVC